MKEIKAAKSFKKDIKRYANQPKKLHELYEYERNLNDIKPMETHKNDETI